MKKYILYLITCFFISCSNNDVFIEAGFVKSDGFFNQLISNMNGEKMILCFKNNSFGLSCKDSIFIAFNNYFILKDNFKFHNIVCIPNEVFQKNIQTSIIIRKNGVSYFSVYEGCDLIVNTEKSIIYVTFISNITPEKMPYKIEVVKLPKVMR